jgi:hypothetical protein
MLVLHNASTYNHLSSIITTIRRRDYHVCIIWVSIHNFLVEWIIIIRIIACRRYRCWVRYVVFARCLLLCHTNKCVICRNLLNVQMRLLRGLRYRRGRSRNSWIIYPQNIIRRRCSIRSWKLMAVLSQGITAARGEGDEFPLLFIDACSVRRLGVRGHSLWRWGLSRLRGHNNCRLKLQGIYTLHIVYNK